MVAKPVVASKVLPSVPVTVLTRAWVLMAVLWGASVTDAPPVLVAVARAEVRGSRAAPVVLAEARAPSQYWAPKKITWPDSPFVQASLAQSRTP